jgi:hypothetical protein
MPLTRIDSAFLDLDAIGGIDFDVNNSVPTLKVDATTHRVGIGHNSPETQLHMFGSYPTLKIQNSDTAQYASASIDLQGPAGDERYTKILHGNSNTGGTETHFQIEQYDSAGSYVKTLSRYNYQYDYWAFHTGATGTEKLRITSDGKVGIGTNNPSNMLEIYGSTPTIELTDSDTGVIHRINANSGVGIWYFDNDINNVGSDGSYVFRHGHANGGGTVFSISAAGTITLGADSGTIRRSGDIDTYINFMGSDRIRFVTANSEQLRIDASGNVGIGSQAPTTKLDVNGTVTATAFSGSGANLTNVNATTLDSIDSGSFLRSDTDDNGQGFGSRSSVNSTGDPGLLILNGGRLGFDQTGTRSWTVKASGGNLNVNSGDGVGSLTGQINASTLDSIDSSSFLRSDADDTTTSNLIINTSTNAKHLYISRSGSTSNEYTRIGRDDTITHFHTKNDEASSTVRFRFENTDTESGGGANANDRNIDLISDSTSARITIDGNTVWHAGNDGSGSGLDADTVDGVDSGSFLRSDAADTWSADISTTSTNGIRFGSANQTDANDGYIAAGKFASGLNIVGTQTVAGTGRQIRLWGDLIDSSGNKFWSAGNDGSGSGLDADTLDGIDSGSFLRSDANDTFTGVLDSSGDASGYRFDGRSFSWNSSMQTPTTKVPHVMQDTWSGWDPVIGIKTQNGFWQFGAYTSNTLHLGYMAGAFGSHSTNSFDNSLAISPSSMSFNGNTIWHGGNDGSGSGLDADLLDGQQPSVAVVGNSIVQRHSSGYIYANYFNTTPNDVTSGVTKICCETGNDGFIRHATADAVRGFIDDGRYLRSNASDIYGSTSTGNILTIQCVNGRVGNTGSGSQFPLEIKQNTVNKDAAITFHIGGDYAGYFGLDGTTNDLFWGGWSRGAAKYRIWHAANDGGGSGLDADLLDGQQGSYYINTSTGQTANLYIRNGSPTVYLRDTNHRSSMLHCNSNLFYVLRGSGNDSTTWATTGGQWPLVVNLENNNVTIGGNGYVGGSTIITSDERLKTDIQPIAGALEKVKALRGVTFYRTDMNQDQLRSGLIAQEVESVLPHIVDENNVQQDPETGEILEETRYKGVAYEELHPYLIEAIKEQQALIEALTARIEALENP